MIGTLVKAPATAVYYARRNPDATLVLAGVAALGLLGAAGYYWWSHRGLSEAGARSAFESWANSEFEAKPVINTLALDESGDWLVNFTADQQPFHVTVSKDGSVSDVGDGHAWLDKDKSR